MGSSNDVPWLAHLSATAFSSKIRSHPSGSRESGGVWIINGPFKRLTVTLPAVVHSRYRVIVLETYLYRFRT